MLEHLAANWTHIRRDVKAENSRIAALLSSADPAAVTEDKISLAAPYEFHRNKINEDSTRQVIERVLQQYTHSKHQLLCLAPEEVPASQPAAPLPKAGPQGSNRESGTETKSGAATGTSTSSGDDEEPDQTSAIQSGEVADDSGETETSAPSESTRARSGDAGPEPQNNTEEQVDSIEDADRQRVEAARRIFEARENP
jgi:chromosomal replication initiation ATPase DnaA